MANQKHPGPVKRAFGAAARAIKRAILGKSSYEYVNQIAGGDEYWDRMIAAEQGWGSPPGLERRSAGRAERKESF
jgi:hypothetical protein